MRRGEKIIRISKRFVILFCKTRISTSIFVEVTLEYISIVSEEASKCI